MFKCKTCGYIASVEHAGECQYPHACSVCGAGISYNPKTGVKIFDAANWEVLGELPCGLKELPTIGKEISVSTGNVLGLTQSAQ